MKLFTVETNGATHTRRNMYGVDVVEAEYPPKYEIDGQGFAREEFGDKRSFISRVQQLTGEGHTVERHPR